MNSRPLDGYVNFLNFFLDVLSGTGVQYPGMKKLMIKKNPAIRKTVYYHIREQILNGVIGPNERLTEAKLAKEIGTSRTPVREALHSLELEKFIKSISSVGYVVLPISEEDVEQMCEIRGLIEGLAATWAIRKAHKKLVKELAKNIAASEKAIARGDVQAFMDLDGQFHETIAKLSGSDRLLEFAQTLRRHMLRYRAQTIYLSVSLKDNGSRDQFLRAIEGHKRILEAIKTADNVSGVNDAIRCHLEQSKQDILSYALRESGQ
jgi:DNA-binding GntR family transcriptional regulator